MAPKIKIGAFQASVSQEASQPDKATLVYADRDAHRKFIVKLIGEEEMQRIDQKAEAEYATR